MSFALLFFISLFTAQHDSNISTFIFRKLRITLDLFHLFYFAGSICVRLGLCGILMQAEALRMDVLTFERCSVLNNEIIKQVTSS